MVTFYTFPREHWTHLRTLASGARPSRSGGGLLWYHFIYEIRYMRESVEP